MILAPAPTEVAIEVVEAVVGVMKNIIISSSCPPFWRDVKDIHHERK